ncbi:MAG: ArsR family transcriptional regulator [Candidatus Lambdaproteobacteria bacterium RIFOXYD2_FULL_50_16]|uniref:ArsR family transcriptional regulator n=1 Tax=Candidatus Lambdaproteobacteria bacterium RIFOXYD2_FULL_50_16 TaxID=1817772 RepID=A0A1F6G993_9PROT|nr:MAG: ArsR family transcriptional regulator [Candidatus Lambdaproteobacteria bacterium RIFOXYD2_FULL_50_16]
MADFKHLLYSQFAKIAKAMSSPHRLEVLEYLSQREHSVESLAKVSGLTYANCSQHLQQLKAVGLVLNRKEGQHVYYSIANDMVHECLESLAKIARNNLAEVDRLIEQHLTAKDSLEAISSEDLIERLKEDSVTLIDVRPADEFQAGHIAGAINVTLSELEDFIAEYQAHKEVIAYCRGPYCILSYEAVKRMRAKGIETYRLAEGYPEWHLAGHPVDQKGSTSEK